MSPSNSPGWLDGLSENVSGQRFALEGETILIGRGSGCQIQIKDPKISRKHARITIEAGRITIEDLGSTHGVLINSERVKDGQLKDGDSIQLGDTYLQVHLEQDSIATVMLPQEGVPSAAGTCPQCGNHINEGEKFCSRCGSSSLPLPEPFDFVQKAFFRLRALHRAGKMDSATYREELEKLVVQDGAGGYWMLGVDSGAWFWSNGSEWIRRDPPLTPLKQAPLEAFVPIPPPPPQSGPNTVEAEDDNQLKRKFVIGGGALIAFTVLAIGAYAASTLVNTDGGVTPVIENGQPAPASTVIQPSPTPEAELTAAEQPAYTTASPQDPAASAPPLLPYAIRAYDPTIDEGLVSLAEITDYVDALSSPEHSFYEGTWESHRPGQFPIGWCAIDANTLNQNLQVIEMSLDVDGTRVEPSEMYELDIEDTDLYCKTYLVVVEFSESGEHRFLWTTSYSEPVFDGWQTLEPGTFTNEFVLDIRNVVSIEDDFNESSGKWDETIQQNFSQWTEAGSFHIQVHKENFAAWSTYHTLEVDDILILTRAKRVSEVGGEYGIIFRYQDVSNFYYFMVDDAGTFRLGKRLEGVWIDLIESTPSDTILAGDELNSLGVTAIGDELVAFINLNVVGEVTDGSFGAGGVGLIAQSMINQAEMHAEYNVFSVEYYE